MTDMKAVYDDVCFATSRLVTNRYSTSFSIGVRCLDRNIRNAVYGIYGFVRLADEIVDTFHGYDKERMLAEFGDEYFRASARGISTNPVINAFRATADRYAIDDALVAAFLHSMRMDLDHSDYTDRELSEYIYGSAEVVGLMCLKVFVAGDEAAYEGLKPFAQRLGAAFQKVNFLRDLGSDMTGLRRVYFPALTAGTLTEEVKRSILDDIYADYREAEKGIRRLPACARLGVYTAYLYYKRLAGVIERTPAERLLRERVRISNGRKALLFGKACLTGKFI